MCPVKNSKVERTKIQMREQPTNVVETMKQKQAEAASRDSKSFFISLKDGDEIRIRPVVALDGAAYVYRHNKYVEGDVAAGVNALCAEDVNQPCAHCAAHKSGDKDLKPYEAFVLPVMLYDTNEDGDLVNAAPRFLEMTMASPILGSLLKQTDVLAKRSLKLTDVDVIIKQEKRASKQSRKSFSIAYDQAGPAVLSDGRQVRSGIPTKEVIVQRTAQAFPPLVASASQAPVPAQADAFAATAPAQPVLVNPGRELPAQKPAPAPTNSHTPSKEEADLVATF